MNVDVDEHVDVNKPFVLRTDTFGQDELPKLDGTSSVEELLKLRAKVAVGFMSRKMTEGQRLWWDTHDNEMYAVVSVLDK